MPQFILTNLYSYCIASYLINNLSLFVQLTTVHFVDAHRCFDPGKYVIALLLSLSTMLHLELPHINILSKIDVIESYGKLGGVGCIGHPLEVDSYCPRKAQTCLCRLSCSF